MSNLGLGPTWLDRFFGAITLTAADFIQPLDGATVLVQMARTASMIVGQTLYIQNAGYYRVESLTSDTTNYTVSALIRNIDTSNAVPTTLIPSGSLVGPAGPAGPSGATIDVPAVGNTSLSTARDQIVRFDATAGSMTIDMPNTALNYGTKVLAIDASDATSLSKTVTFNDFNGLKFQDPDSRVLSAGATFVITAPRNILWVLTHSAPKGTYWASA